MNYLFFTVIMVACSLCQKILCQSEYSDRAFRDIGYGTQGFDPTRDDDYEYYDDYDYGYDEDYDYGYDEDYDEYFEYSNYYDYYTYSEASEVESFIEKLPCKVNKGVQFSGGDLLVDDDGNAIYFVANSFRDCAIACGIHPDCEKYTFLNFGSENRGCYFKKASGYTSAANEFAVSGDGCSEAKYANQDQSTDYSDSNSDLDYYQYSNFYEYYSIPEGGLESFIQQLPCEVNQGVALQGGALKNGDSKAYFRTNSFRDCAIACGMNTNCAKYTNINYGGENQGCYFKQEEQISLYTSVANEYAVSGDACLEAKYTTQ